MSDNQPMPAESLVFVNHDDVGVGGDPSNSISASSRSHRISSDEFCDPLSVETGQEANPNDSHQSSGSFASINKHPLSAISPQSDRYEEEYSTPSDVKHTDDEFAVLCESGPESIEDRLAQNRPAKARSISFQYDDSSKNCYLEEFRSLFSEPNYYKKLKVKAMKGDLGSCRFRSICWKLFLECLPENQNEWLAKTRELRERYKVIADSYAIDPRGSEAERKETPDDPKPFSDPLQDNPLSQDDTSTWNIFFKDNELRSTIKQDVVRTFPEIDYFQSEYVQNILVNILFHFAKEKPKLAYKQGMHELLAPLLFVLNADIQTFLHAKEIGLVEDDLNEILDARFIEHDAYFMFAQVMESVEPWYCNDIIQSRSGLSQDVQVTGDPFTTPTSKMHRSVLGVKLQMINEQIVKRNDPKLYEHMTNLEIAPQVYGIRWMRLLFGREFPFQDLLLIWDAIFADSLSFALCEYIFAAMLIVIRKLLLNSDYAQCIGHLMRYPTVPDVHYVIHKALNLRDPANYAGPIGFSSYYMPNLPPPSTIHDVQTGRNKQQISSTGDIAHRAQKGINRKSVSDLQFHTKTEPAIPAIPETSSSLALGRSKTSRAPAVRPKSLAFSDPRPSSSTLGHSRDKALNVPKRAVSVDHPLATPSSATPTPITPASINPRKGSYNELRPINDPAMTSNAELREQLETLEAKTEFCVEYLSQQIDKLQECLSRQTALEGDDQLFVAVAEVKKVRDILRGTLRISDIKDISSNSRDPIC